MQQLIKKFNNLTLRQKTYFAFGFFAVLIFLFYGNTLQNGFVFDDEWMIRDNPYVKSLRDAPRIFFGCSWPDGCTTAALYYRPVAFWAPMVTYQFSSAPWAFHFFNLLYYIGAIWLLFFFVKLLTKDRTTAFLAALFFTILPVHTEVVNSMSSAVEILLLIFILSSAILYIQYRRTKSVHKLIFANVCYFFALLSKEPAIFLLPMIFFLDILFLRLNIKDFIRGKEVRPYLFFAATTALYFVLRNIFLGFVNVTAIGDFSFIERIYLAVTLFGRYSIKMFNPYPLFGYLFERSTDLLSITFLGSFLLVVLYIVALGIFFIKKKNLFAFCLIWFVGFLALALVFLGGRVEGFFAERYAFVSSIAPAIMAAAGVSYILKRYARYRSVVFVGIAVIIIASWLVIFPQNRAWADDETLARAMLEANPKNYTLEFILGDFYLTRGNLDLAYFHFEHLISSVPDWREITTAHKGMGDYWRIQGDMEQALKSYLQSVQTTTGRPRDWVPFNDIGLIYLQQDQPLLAMTYFCQSTQLFSTQQNQDNLNAALSFVDEQYIQEGTIREAILEHFTLALSRNISFVGQRCDAKACQHAFAVNPQNTDIIPPALITATTSGKNAAITNQSYDFQNSLIVLETDVKYENEELTFLFPTCSREYYEAKASN